MNNTQIVTIANRIPQEWYYLWNELLKSIEGNELLVLGQEAGEYTGLSDKPRILHKAISDGKIKSSHMVFIDAFDVVFADSLDVVIEKYKSMDVPLVIGGEKNCFPSCFKKEYDRLPHMGSSYRYLNSGVIIGEVDAMMEVLEAMDAPNLPRDYHNPSNGQNYHFNDQAYYMDLYLRQPVPMGLDYQCFIAQNMQDVTEEELDFTGERIKNKETEETPSIIHFNGGSKDKWGREPVLKHLNLI